MPTEIQGETYYTIQEACAFLSTSKPTLSNLAKEGLLTKHYQGISPRVYYKLADLQRVLDERRKDSNV